MALHVISRPKNDNSAVNPLLNTFSLLLLVGNNLQDGSLNDRGRESEFVIVNVTFE